MAMKPKKKQDIQSTIVDVLAARGLTRYWLALECGWPPSRIYRMLRRPTSSAHIQRMCDVLDLVLVPRAEARRGP